MTLVWKLCRKCFASKPSQFMVIASKSLNKAYEYLLVNGLLFSLLERVIKIASESLSKACEAFMNINFSGASEKIIRNFTKF